MAACLLGTHVGQCALHASWFRHDRFDGEIRIGDTRDAEIENLDLGTAIERELPLDMLDSRITRMFDGLRSR